MRIIQFNEIFFVVSCTSWNTRSVSVYLLVEPCLVICRTSCRRFTCSFVVSHHHHHHKHRCYNVPNTETCKTGSNERCLMCKYWEIFFELAIVLRESKTCWKKNEIDFHLTHWNVLCVQQNPKKMPLETTARRSRRKKKKAMFGSNQNNKIW